MRLRGLRTWLLLLVVAATAPGLALVLREHSKVREGFEHDLRMRASSVARGVAAAEQAKLDDAKGFLVGLAELPSVKGHDAEACSLIFATLRGRYPNFANLGAAAPDGSIFCSAIPGARPPIADREDFRRVLATREPAVGDYRVGRRTGLPIVHVAAPSLGPDGEVVAVVYAGIDLHAMAARLAGFPVPSGTTLTVLDRHGTIMAGTPECAGRLGRRADAAPFALALRTAEGVWEGPGLDGRRRVHAHLAMSLSGGDPDLVVVAGLAREPLLAPVEAIEMHTMIGYLLVLLGGLVVAWFIGDLLLVRRLGRLAAVARRLSDGDLAARTGLEANDEIGSLARTFDEMAVAIERNIAERHQLEAQLRQAQKMEAIGRLAGGVAHDFNNLLTVVLSIGHSLAERLPADHPLHPDVAELVTAGRRGADLTRQLLAFGRKQVLAPVALDPNAVVRGLERLLERLIGERVRIATALGASGQVLADRGQLEQVIVNLVVNARDAMPGGGEVAIGTADVDRLGRACDRFDAPPGRYVMISVADSGTGMDEHTVSRLFEPFFTTKGPSAGTGLGLSTAYGIVKQSGGDIRVESALHRGTRFEILLPRCQAAAAPEPCPSAPHPAPARAGGERLLVVEDNPLVRAVTCRTLSAAGYRIVEAASAEEALREEAAMGPIDLLVTDVVLPGLNGRELADRLQRARPGLGVLFVSGYTGGANLAGVPAGAYLQKPFTPDALLSRVRDLLDRGEPSSRARATEEPLAARRARGS